jgi:ABC-type branched-subunit amino acid transport system permease subunit
VLFPSSGPWRWWVYAGALAATIAAVIALAVLGSDGGWLVIGVLVIVLLIAAIPATRERLGGSQGLGRRQ